MCVCVHVVGMCVVYVCVWCMCVCMCICVCTLVYMFVCGKTGDGVDRKCFVCRAPCPPDQITLPFLLSYLLFSLKSQVVTHYLVKWCSLPYEDSTWELEVNSRNNRRDMLFCM